MLQLYASCAALAAAVYWYLNRHKPLWHIIAELRTALDMQCVGFAGLVDDKLQGWRNKIELPDATGRVAVVTGGARGIGLQVIRRLLDAKMVVAVGLRDPKALNPLKDSLEKPSNLLTFELDLNSLESVRKFARNITSTFPEVHLLVHNAGVMFGDYRLTEDGVESQLAVNYLGHFCLTHLLLPALRRGGVSAGKAARVVAVSSCGHYPGKIHYDDINMREHYDPTAAYAQSKLAQVMCARYTDKLMEEEGYPVRCYSVHPGVVDTDLFEGTAFRKYFAWAMRLFFKNTSQGAIPIIYACFSQDLDKRGGLYISNCREGYSNSFSKNPHFQYRLHLTSCQMIGIKPEEFGKPAES